MDILDVTCPNCHTTQRTILPNLVDEDGAPNLVDEDGAVVDYEYNLERCNNCRKTFVFRLEYIPRVVEVYSLQPEVK